MAKKQILDISSEYPCTSARKNKKISLAVDALRLSTLLFFFIFSMVGWINKAHPPTEGG